MALSKLSLSKNKVAKHPHAATPSTASVAKPAAGTAGPKATSSASLLRILQNDSDWEDSSSDSEASQPAPCPPLATVSSGGRGGPAAPAAQLLQRSDRPPVTAQPRLSGLCDLEVFSSSEEEDEARVPDAQPAGGGPQADSAQRAQQQPHAARPGWHPRQQPDAKQPQHRKRSYDQAAAPAAGGRQPLPPPAAAAAAAAPAAAGAPRPGASRPAQLSSEVPTELPSEPSSVSPGCSLAGGSEPSASSDADLPEYQAVKAWLQGLGLCQYFQLFVREEIDLTIVHALTCEDLAGIGIAQRSHQQALVAAGQRVGAERRAAQQHHHHQQQQQQQQQQGRQGQQDWRQQAAGQAAQPVHPSRLGPAGAPALAPLQPAPRQQQQHPPVGGPQPAAKVKQAAGRGSHQSLLQVWQANSAAQAAAAAGGACDNAVALQQQLSGAGAGGAGMNSEQCEGSEAHFASLTHAGTRPTERALLAALYPPQYAQPDRAAQAAEAALLPGQHGLPPWARGQALRPSSAAGPAARVPAGATLWAAAGECRPVAAGMEERLNKRRSEAGLDGVPQEKLARGGTAYPQGDESRALKVMKLEGLRQELAMHEETAAQLRRMIADMEAELGQGS